jgi:DNA-directed RNA polymerase sigma subunit (sigma70/sigma32)
VFELAPHPQDPLSLESPLGEEDDSTLGDFVEDHDAEAPVASASFRLLQDYLRIVLEEFSERERQVLVMRFGLADGKIHTLEQVATLR